VAVGLWAYFPYPAAKTEEITIMIIMVAKPNDDIYTPARIEKKLHAVYMFAAISLSGNVCRRPVSF
jgi:hypothetical protein